MGYTKDYEVPTMSEGFSEIKTINWVFEGDAEAKRRWSMWLQLDGEWASPDWDPYAERVYQTRSRRNNL
jgi:hypothetical protein